MMKLPIVFLAVLGLAFGKSIPTHSTKNLQDDLNDFLALVPVDNVLAIAIDYLANDAQVQELMVYVQSEEFHTIIQTVESLPEFDNFINFLNDLGLDVTGYINSIHDIIGLPPLPTIRKHMRRGVGVDGLIDDIIAILPIDDLRALFDSKLETSPDFKAFYDAIGSPEFQSIIQTLNDMPEYQTLLQKLRDYGVDVDHYLELLRALFGLTKKSAIGTRNLQDDLNDFLALVPVDQVLAIGLDYLANDSQVRELVAYVQTEEFHSIILTVEAIPEFSNFVSFLNDLGLDITGYINSIHDFIGLPHLPTIRKHMRRGVGVDGLIDDIIAILPIDDLRALFDSKLETSPDFKAFYDAIGSPEFQSIIQTLNDMPEYQALLQKLRDYGVDVDHYLELLRALFGLTKKSAIGTRNLQDDLNDFLALVPVDQVLAIGLDYLANDSQVRELVAYVQTEEFHSIILTVEAIPEFSNFVSFLNDLGLDITGYINSIHDFIGLPHLPTIRKHMRRGVGVDGLIDDIIAILPIDDLRALFDSKLETSPDFKAFYDAIGSPEFQSIIQTLNDMPEYQTLLQKLRDYGVDVDHYLELLRALFGLTKKSAIGTRNLQDDLNDFLALVPVDQVLAIGLDYLANDSQVRELVAYVQTEEFHSIILTVEAIPEFSNFVSFLNDLGLDITGYINSIHDFIGLPHLPTIRKHMRRGVGVDGLIDDIIAILPIDDLRALFDSKLETSPDFKAFYDAIGSPEFQSIIQTLNDMPEYQALLQKLRDYGVDVDHYLELLRALFGLTQQYKSTRNLQDDLNELIALIPVDRVLSIALDYLANDAQVQEFMIYLQGEEFQTIVLTVEAVPAFGNIINFVKEHGLDVTGFISILHDILGIPPYSPSSKNLLRRGVGINGFIEDIVAVIPLDQVLALFQDKLQNSADFQALYEEIHTPEFLTIIDTLRGLQEYQDLLQSLRDYGVDVDYYIDLIMQLLGFSRRSTRNLQDDLNELIALIPVDQVLSIALDYLANDAQVQELMVYFQGDEFQTIVLTVEAVPAFGNIINFVKEHGLDVTGFISILHDILGIPPYSPSSKNLLRRGVGINGFIEDIVAVIPLDQVLALFQDKLQNSADFQALYEEIHTPEFLTIIDTLRGLQEYQDLLQSLRDYGVDVDYYIDLIMQLLGFSRRSTRNLQDDLNELIALIPVDQVLSIALDYLANDAQVQELMVYFQGDEFQTIVLTVEAVPAFGNIINFVKEHGLDVTGFISILHDILGIPPYSPSSKNLLRRGVGINGFIEDIVAVIPLDQVLALFQDKLQNSADFQALYEEIHTPEFLTIIDTLRGLQEYQDLLQSLRDYGVDVDYYIDLIMQLLGFSRRSTRNLQDDLNELIALIPVDQVLSIALDYLANDAQVQELMVYFQGDEFQTIVLTVEAVPAFGNIINFVKEHGLDVTGFISILHDILGIPPYSPSSKNLLRRGVGINGFIEDIVAVIPLDQVLALFQDKLQNSADFQALYEEIHTPEFLTIIDTLKGMQEYQDLLQRLRDYGVDVDYYIDLINQLLGFTKVVL